MFGFLNINKAPGLTSRAVVNAVQKLVRPAKVGHAGTLDPLATGVLVVCIGPATRLADLVQGQAKSYVGDFRLGVESDTEDVEGELQPVAGASEVSEEQIRSELPNFRGKIEQFPPKFSALKVGGVRAYDLARQGKPVDLKPRSIEIYSLDLLDVDYPNMRLQVRCGSGTYIRSLGRDIGRSVGSGAIMTALVRTEIGQFKLADALPSTEIDRDTIRKHLIAPQLGLPSMTHVTVSDDQAAGFLNGVALEVAPQVRGRSIAAIDQHGRLQAVMQSREIGVYTPKINFAHYWRDLK